MSKELSILESMNRPDRDITLCIAINLFYSTYSFFTFTFFIFFPASFYSFFLTPISPYDLSVLHYIPLYSGGKITIFTSFLGNPDHRVHEFWIPQEISTQNEESDAENPAPVLEALVFTGWQLNIFRAVYFFRSKASL